MVERVLILGGTAEAAALAAERVAAGDDVTTSLAGRTKEPRPLAGRVRSGGFGGAAGLARYLRDGGFDHLIDATHPFASHISRNAAEAARLAGVRLTVRERPPWTPHPDDLWDEVASLREAAASLGGGTRVLLALGSQHLSAFAARADVHFVVRMIDRPEAPLALPDHTLVLGRPSRDPSAEAAMLREHRVERIVCRNSGGSGAYAKLVAARQLRLPVSMVARP